MYPADYTPGIIASDVLRIRPDKTKLLPSFLMCQFHYSSNVVNQIEMVGNGQIMKGINVTKLKNMELLLCKVSRFPSWQLWKDEQRRCGK